MNIINDKTTVIVPDYLSIQSDDEAFMTPNELSENDSKDDESDSEDEYENRDDITIKNINHQIKIAFNSLGVEFNKNQDVWFSEQIQNHEDRNKQTMAASIMSMQTKMKCQPDKVQRYLKREKDKLESIERITESFKTFEKNMSKIKENPLLVKELMKHYYIMNQSNVVYVKSKKTKPITKNKTQIKNHKKQEEITSHHKSNGFFISNLNEHKSDFHLTEDRKFYDEILFKEIEPIEEIRPNISYNYTENKDLYSDIKENNKGSDNNSSTDSLSAEAPLESNQAPPPPPPPPPPPRPFFSTITTINQQNMSNYNPISLYGNFETMGNVNSSRNHQVPLFQNTIIFPSKEENNELNVDKILINEISSFNINEGNQNGKEENNVVTDDLSKSWEEIFPNIPVTQTNIIQNYDEMVFTSEPPPPTLFAIPEEEMEKEPSEKSERDVELHAAKSAIEFEKFHYEKLENVERKSGNFGTDNAFRNTRRDIKKKITMELTQVSGTWEQVENKVKNLIIIFDHFENDEMRYFGYDMLARIIASKSETMDAGLAYPLAEVLMSFVKHHPEALSPILAYLHKVSVLTVPKVYSGEQDEEFLNKMKFKDIDEGESERRENYDEFLNRQIGYVSLYAAMTQARHQVHGIEFAWRFISRLVNNLPPNRISATALYSFLKIAGFKIYRKYNVQFVKVLQYIDKVFLEGLRNCGDEESRAVYSRLHTYLQMGQFGKSPKEWNMPERDNSSAFLL